MLPEYDIIVVGGGHAGCEAAYSSAKMGSKVLLVTMNLATIAQMSCNPAMGGVAKGQRHGRQLGEFELKGWFLRICPLDPLFLAPHLGEFGRHRHLLPLTGLPLT